MPSEAELEAQKALRCLYIVADEVIARDVGQKVNEAFNVLRREHAELEAENAELRCALDMATVLLAEPNRYTPRWDREFNYLVDLSEKYPAGVP